MHMDYINADTENQDIPAEADEQTVETHKNSKLALAIAFLALFFTVIGITVGYKHWLRIHDKAKLALQEISSIQQQLKQTARQSSVDELRKHFEETSNAADQRLADSIHELDKIREKTEYSAKTVTDQIAALTIQNQNQTSNSATQSGQPGLAEIRFLLESAKRRLNISYDKKSALALLKEADKLFIQLNSPQWLTIREKLANDIATLQQFSLPDIDALSTQIDRLDKAIIPLAQVEKTLPNSEEVLLFENPDTEKLTGKIKAYLNDSITIHKQTDPPRYALDKSNKERIDLLLELRLESLRLMLYERNNEAWHQQIARLRHMLDVYYPPTIAKPWLDTLDRLDRVNLAPPLPNINSALEEMLAVQENHTPKKPGSSQ